MKQRGIVKLEGTYDDVTFYRSNGRSLARRKPEISKARFKNDPAFARQRANMSEFKGSAMIGKAIRTALLRELIGFSDATGNRSVTGMLQKVVQNGAGLYGERSFDLYTNRHLLKGLEFMNKDPLVNILYAPHNVSTVTARNEATLTVPDFNTKSSLKKPVGATHFRLLLSIGTVSDYAYDALLGYQPLNPSENQLSALVSSPLIPIGGMVGGVTTLNAVLPNAPVISSSTALFAAVGVEFVQRMGAHDYLLHDNKCLKIIEVF